MAKMKPRCLRARGESSVDSAVPAPETGYSPPAPKPAMPRLTVSIQNRPLSLVPCDTAVMMIPMERKSVVNTAPDLRPRRSLMKPNASIPMMRPMMKALVNCDCVATLRVSGYSTVRSKRICPIRALLYASLPMARPEKRTMKKMDLFEYRIGAWPSSKSRSAVGVAWVVTFAPSSFVSSVGTGFLAGDIIESMVLVFSWVVYILKTRPLRNGRVRCHRRRRQLRCLMYCR